MSNLQWQILGLLALTRQGALPRELLTLALLGQDSSASQQAALSYSIGTLKLQSLVEVPYRGFLTLTDAGRERASPSVLERCVQRLPEHEQAVWFGAGEAGTAASVIDYAETHGKED